MKVFDVFKSKGIKKGVINPSAEIYIQLCFVEQNSYIRIVNKNNKEVETDYRGYRGYLRDFLKAIEGIRDRNDRVINWEFDDNHIYLSGHEYLIGMIKKSDRLVDQNMDPIHFGDDHGDIILKIEETGGNRLKCQIVLHCMGKTINEGHEFVFVNENHLLLENNIYEVQPLGEHYKNLHHFNSEIKNEDLENYLSLVYSYFSDIHVQFGEYLEERGGPRQTKPTLIFEKVDSNESLYLNVVSSLSGYSVNFFADYDISRVASLNEIEKKIVISEVVHGEIGSAIQEIKRSLIKIKKGNSNHDANNYHMEENLFILEKSLAESFIHKELPGLLNKYIIVGTEKLKSYKIRHVSPQLRLSLSHGIDFLEGEANLEIEGESFSLFHVLNQYRRNNYITLGDGSHAVINQSYLEKLERLFKKKGENVKISFFDLPIVEELIGEKVAEEMLPKSREIFLGFNNLKEDKTKIPALSAKLRPYQRQGFAWLNYLHLHHLGGCLADDMGLGKTIQAISILAKIYPKEKTPSLIVMPRSLLFNWAQEIEKFCKKLSVYTYYSTNRDLNSAKKCNIILTTYGMIRNDIKVFQKEEFHYIILDESQHIKNVNSQIARAVVLLSGKHRLSLSGTPIENNIVELYSLFRFLNPSMFGSLDDFNRNYSYPIQQRNDKEAMSELRKKIYPFILRRLKSDVLKDLPDKVEQTLIVEMSAEQKKFYEERRAFYYKSIKGHISDKGVKKSQFFILQALLELRQIAAIPESKTDGEIISPKRELLIEYILDAISNNHKALVFGNFISIIEHVASDLEKENIKFLTMTGATRNRQQLVEQFQNDPMVKVFVMTLKTGGVGLNLTAADRIFIFDPWWNLAAENQAIDRTHRIGQDKTVFSYKLITKGTIEEKILLLQEKKKELFDNVISSDSASIKTLNEKDVDFILG